MTSVTTQTRIVGKANRDTGAIQVNITLTEKQLIEWEITEFILEITIDGVIPTEIESSYDTLGDAVKAFNDVCILFGATIIDLTETQ